LAKWKKQTLKLKDDHGWKSRPGYRILVLGRGAVRIDIPQDWVVEPGKGSLQILDRKPPDDDCRLEVSFNQVPRIDWSRLPLAQLLTDVISDDHRAVTHTGDIRSEDRSDLRLVWTEVRFTDPVENREAYSRILIGIGGNVQCLLTMDYWTEDAERVTPVWDEAVKTLQVARYIADPTTGKPIEPWLN
jgi:hypothetical protein